MPVVALTMLRPMVPPHMGQSPVVSPPPAGAAGFDFAAADAPFFGAASARASVSSMVSAGSEASKASSTTAPTEPPSASSATLGAGPLPAEHPAKKSAAAGSV